MSLRRGFSLTIMKKYIMLSKFRKGKGTTLAQLADLPRWFLL